MTISTRAIGAEIRKIASVRALVALPLATLAYAVLAFLPALTMPAAEREAMNDDALLSIVRGPGFVVAVAMLLLGVLAVGTEFRHRTIGSTLVVLPSRMQLAASKAAAVAIVAAATAVAVEALSLSFGYAFLETNGITQSVAVVDIAASTAAVIAVAVLYALAGVGLGFIARDQTFAVGAALVWLFVVEGAIPIVLRQPWLFKWLPGGAANAVLGVAEAPPDLLPAWAGGLLLAGVVAVLASAGTALFATRDVD